MTRRRTRVPVFVALCLAVSAGVMGCGKKPAFVDPPEEVETDEFPRTYPTS